MTQRIHCQHIDDGIDVPHRSLPFLVDGKIAFICPLCWKALCGIVLQEVISEGVQSGLLQLDLVNRGTVRAGIDRCYASKERLAEMLDELKEAIRE